MREQVGVTMGLLLVEVGKLVMMGLLVILVTMALPVEVGILMTDLLVILLMIDLLVEVGMLVAVMMGLLQPIVEVGTLVAFETDESD